MGTDGLGMEVPSGVQEQGSGGSLGAKPPEARYAYTICSGQTHFRDVFIEDIYGVPSGSCGVCYTHPTPPKNSSNLAEVGWARAYPCPTVDTPLLNIRLLTTALYRKHPAGWKTAQNLVS